MQISVFSEVSRLEHVLIHRPGAELEQLTPSRLEHMLFDDIPFVTGAQKEHDAFAQALKKEGVTVHYLVDLITETLSQDEKIKIDFIEDFISLSGQSAIYHSKEIRTLLLNFENTRDMVIKTMTGINLDELKSDTPHQLAKLVRQESPFVTLPMPNLYFTRDPMASIGHGASLSSMYAPTRKRESLYSKYILKYYSGFSSPVPLYYDLTLPYPIEGGDILCVGNGLLLVGISQRTSPEAIELLAKNLFNDPDCHFMRILALDIPKIRAFMHLDTVMTQVDIDCFTIHPAILHNLKIYSIAPKAGGDIAITVESGELQTVLTKYMHKDKIKLIPCGGSDIIAAQREQWNDASNTLCISPGTVIVYDRNAVTNAMIQDEGINIIEIPGSELGRGRGGPRCMTMPLVRTLG